MSDVDSAQINSGSSLEPGLAQLESIHNYHSNA